MQKNLPAWHPVAPYSVVFALSSFLNPGKSWAIYRRLGMPISKPNRGYGCHILGIIFALAQRLFILPPNLGNPHPRLANKGGHFGDTWDPRIFLKLRGNHGQSATA